MILDINRSTNFFYILTITFRRKACLSKVVRLKVTQEKSKQMFLQKLVIFLQNPKFQNFYLLENII